MDLLEADLIAERDRAIPHLDHQGPVLSPVDLPDDPGLYALKITSGSRMYHYQGTHSGETP
jgi:hypothetical protein